MFLDYFGQPVLQLLPEGDAEKESTLMTSDLSKALAINSAKSMGLFFTPNGNFARHYTEGGAIAGVRNKENGSGWNCFFIDFDIKDTNYESLESYRDAIADGPLSDVMQPSFIHKSGGGYHVYWLFDEDAKTYLSGIDKDKVTEVWKFFTSIFQSYGADTKVTEIARLMRYPGSMYYKNVYNGATRTTIHSFKAKTLQEFDESDMRMLSLKDIQNTFAYFDSHKQVKPDKKFGTTKHPLSLLEIMESFDEYEVTSTGRIRYQGTLTEGYRYNKSGDYVTDFSGHNRPRGNAISFLYHHFGKDRTAVRNHIDGCGFISDVQDSPDLIKYSNKGIVYRIKSDGGYLSYFKDNDLIESKIFAFNLRCTSRTYSTSVGNKTYDNNHMILTFETEKIKVSTTIPPTMYDFNKKFASYGVLFSGTDAEYKYYTGVILEAKEIPELVTLDEDGYYEKGVYIGGSLVHGEAYDKYHSFVVDEGFNLKIGRNITPTELADICLRYRHPRIVMPCILSFLSLRGMNMYKGLTIYPGLLFSGRTRTGKSTMMSILMNGMGLDNKFRLHSINNMTPQPLQEKCTRYCPAFFEEFTPPLKQDIEQVIRNVLNRDTGSRGRIGGNYIYEYRSPICMVGETRPSEQSVTNRLMITSFKESDKTGVPLKVKELDSYRIYHNVFDVYQANAKNICDDIRSKQGDLIELLGNARMADTYAPMFVMNDYFSLCPQSELVEYVLYHMDICGLTKRFEVKPMTGEDLIVWMITTGNAHAIMDESTRSIKVNIKTGYMLSKLVDISHWMSDGELCSNCVLKDNQITIVGIHDMLFSKLSNVFHPFKNNVTYANV